MDRKQDAREVAWLQAARDGDREAFSRLVERYQRPVFGLCYRMLNDAQAAEDAAQETFLRAYRHLQRYDMRRSFATWLLSIAAHHCIDLLRRKRLATVSLDDEANAWRPPVEPGLSPEAQVIRRQREEQLRALLASLSPKDRAVVVLYYWYDCSCGEIASTLSLTESAVKSRLFRARRELAERWLAQQEQELPQPATEGVGCESSAI
ncbi:MAG: sigma-70 family RNA polymerase sigma factor [Anaerolineae bacterium]|nr:MAG: sigma-70 family RNA polymerase sigma factor [Anaerolineae bacterium]